MLLGGQIGANFLYFWLTAVLSVYLGAKRAAAVARAGKIFQSLDLKNAVAAPFAASVSLFGTYYILKNWQLDIGTIYQVTHTLADKDKGGRRVGRRGLINGVMVLCCVVQLLTTSFGLFCLRDVLASAVLAIKPDTSINSSKVRQHHTLCLSLPSATVCDMCCLCVLGFGSVVGLGGVWPLPLRLARLPPPAPSRRAHVAPASGREPHHGRHRHSGDPPFP